MHSRRRPLTSPSSFVKLLSVEHAASPDDLAADCDLITDNDSAFHADLVHEGVLPVLCGILERHITDASCVHAALRLLATYVELVDDCVTIVGTGGVQAVLRVIATHISHAHVLIPACTVLTGLAECHHTWTAIVASGACWAAVDVLRAHTDPAVVAGACRLLTALCAEDLEAPLLPELVNVLTPRFENSSASAHVRITELLVVLATYTAHDGFTIFSNTSLVPYLLTAVETYQDCVPICENVAVILASLPQWLHSCEITDAMGDMLTRSAVLTTPHLLRCALDVLRLQSKRVELLQRAAHYGVDIWRALLDNDCPVIMEHATTILERLSCRREDVCVMSIGALPHCYAVMCRVHAATLHVRVVRLVWRICTVMPSAVDHVLELGTLPALSRAIELFARQSPKLAMFATRALQAMAAVPGAFLSIACSDILSTLLTSVDRMTPRQTKLMRQVLGAMFADPLLMAAHRDVVTRPIARWLLDTPGNEPLAVAWFARVMGRLMPCAGCGCCVSCTQSSRVALHAIAC